MAQPQMPIRQLTEADAEAYYPVRLRDEPDAFGTSYEEALTRPLSDTIERFRSQAANSDNFTLGAFDGDDRQLIGMVSFWRDTGSKFRHRGAIAAMYVVPNARGRGLGRALLVEALARARASPVSSRSTSPSSAATPRPARSTPPSASRPAASCPVPSSSATPTSTKSSWCSNLTSHENGPRCAERTMSCACSARRTETYPTLYTLRRTRCSSVFM